MPLCMAGGIINYSDNGIGFDIEENRKLSHGMGLRNIYTRIKFLQANIVFTSKKNEGMQCKISVNTNSIK